MHWFGHFSLKYDNGNLIPHSDEFLQIYIVETELKVKWFVLENISSWVYLLRSGLNDIMLIQICSSNLSLIHKCKF